jgi:TolB-like protein/class 3 adenylate cyclase
MTTTRRLAAILAADVAGYSRLIGADEEGTLNRLRSIRAEFIDPKITEHRGRTVKTTGDGLLVEFSSVIDSLRCATQWQHRMDERNATAPGDNRIEFRIGVHQGDIVVEDDDIFGDGVNVAARLEGLAEPGGICVSARVQEDVAGRLDIAFEDIGEQILKNIARPVRVYRVRDMPTRTQRSLRPSLLPLPDRPSIAVLPFQNMSGDPDQEYFTDGMVEEITTALSRIRWLFVIARNSSFTYKGQAVDVKQVARELGVRYVLEGSVRKAGNRVRITGQLIDSSTGAHIWADRFDSTLADIFELQDKVASAVIGAIEPKLRQSEIERALRKPTENLDAYDLYLRALALRDKHTDDSVQEAIALLKQALAIDPAYAPAAALIGWSRIHQLSHGRRPLSEQEIKEAVTLALNPNSAHAWMARGWASFAEPNVAIEALERAMRLSPLDRLGRVFATGIAYAHIAAGRYEKALDWADRSLRLEPDYSGGLLTKAIASTQLGRIEQAHAAIQRLMNIHPWRTAGRIKLFSHLFAPDVAAICIDSLRMAGMPE